MADILIRFIAASTKENEYTEDEEITEYENLENDEVEG